MGLSAFNRMRLKQKEEMKPENIQKKEIDQKNKAEKKEVIETTEEEKEEKTVSKSRSRKQN